MLRFVNTIFMGCYRHVQGAYSALDRVVIACLFSVWQGRLISVVVKIHTLAPLSIGHLQKESDIVYTP